MITPLASDAAANQPLLSRAAARLGVALAERYRMERELSAGGMDTDYLAEDVRHHRQVAIKLLHARSSFR
jgi:hypothetical protein